MRLMIALLGVMPLIAQTDSARLVGTIADPTGAAIPNAKITVKNARTGVVREATSKQDGTYLVPQLAPAVYEITGQAGGLGPTVFRDIGLAVGQERQLNLIFQPATMTQEVTVSGGELVTVDTSSASIGANVNEREVAAHAR